MNEFFKIATFAFTLITVAFLLLDHVKRYLSSRVRFNLILSDFEVLEEAQVVKMDMVIVNHSSSNLAIIAMYYLEDGSEDTIKGLFPPNWSSRYVAPIDETSRYFKKLSKEDKLVIGNAGGMALGKREYKMVGLPELDTFPINMNGYSAIDLNLSFQASGMRHLFDPGLMKHTFLVITSRGVFKKTFTAYAARIIQQ